MASEVLKLHLSNMMDGYAAGQVRLEDTVDLTGYDPVLDSLVALSAAASHPNLNYPTAEFLSALSPKSKGMLLTSALLTDNERLYKPLYSGINHHLGEMYAQDLTSLLGGEHARNGLVEMTKRACQGIGSLEHINTGFSRICASVTPGASLENTKTGIAESQWVEQNLVESRDFLTMVNSTPADLDVESLKTKPLDFYLKKGLQLGSVLVVMGSVAMAGIFATGFANNTSKIGFVDLQTRPAIETLVSKDKVIERKVVQYGEFDGIRLVGDYANRQTLKGSWDSFSADWVTGRARTTIAGEVSDNALCIVSHRQHAPVSQDGNFYKISDLPELIVDKNRWDFFLESHETGHCFFQPDNSNGGARELDDVQLAYQSSLKEIYGDLVASLDYMRQTGTNDLYIDLIRPLRMSTVADFDHKTAWALDVIFPQIDPAAIRLKSKEEIPEMAKYLMEKNFMAKDGTYFPGRLSQRQQTFDTPAVKALWTEITAARKIIFERYDDPQVIKYAEDIHGTMSQHYARYAGVAPQPVLDSAIAVYKEFATNFHLKPIEMPEVSKAAISKPLDSLMSSYL